MQSDVPVVHHFFITQRFNNSWAIILVRINAPINRIRTVDIIIGFYYLLIALIFNFSTSLRLEPSFPNDALVPKNSN